MPYVDQLSRERYKNLTKAIEKISDISTKGDLEFLVFKLMKKFMTDREVRYSTLHDCVYAVAHASDEFRRRYLDIRENEALEKNGDIV
jgi:hypothetical protein